MKRSVAEAAFRRKRGDLSFARTHLYSELDEERREELSRYETAGAPVAVSFSGGEAWTLVTTEAVYVVEEDRVARSVELGGVAGYDFDDVTADGIGTLVAILPGGERLRLPCEPNEPLKVLASLLLALTRSAWATK